MAKTYLGARGITCPVHDTLCFHPASWRPTAKPFPALVALVEGGFGFAVHRTYLATDGTGKTAVEPATIRLVFRSSIS